MAEAANTVDKLRRPNEEAVHRAIIDESPMVWCVLDREGRFSFVTKGAPAIIGYDPKELIGRPAFELLHPDDLGVALQALDQIQVTNVGHERRAEGIPIPMRTIRRDGSFEWFEVGAIPMYDDPEVDGIVIRLRPLRGQHLVDQALEALVASAPLGEVLAYLATSLEQEMTKCHVVIVHSPTGGGFASAIGADLPDVLSGVGPEAEQLDPNETPWGRAASEGDFVDIEVEDLPERLRTAATDAGLFAGWAVPVQATGASPQACVLAWRTHPGEPWVSHKESMRRAARLTSLAFERSQAQAALRHAALHDPLTGLPNRAAFFAQLHEHAGDLSGRASLAVLYVDLDGFKAVNDTLGHAAGDTLLEVIADRLREVVRETDTVARLGGDEFAVLCPSMNDAEAVTTLATRLVEALSAPVPIDGREATVGASVGIALTPTESTSGDHVTALGPVGERLLEAADSALYQAKAEGKGRWVIAEG